MNDTDVIKNDTDVIDEVTLSVYGWPGYQFYLIHIGALVSLTLSITISTGVLATLIKKSYKDFWKRPIGERLVVYLACCDLGFSISHTSDHVFMLQVLGHPPDVPCAIMGFFLNQFVLGQILMVSIMAVNALFMVVMEKKLNFGTYDWRLLTFIMGTPGVLGILCGATGHLGPQGAWCYVDMRKPLGPILSNIVAAAFLFVFLGNMVIYLLVWWKISQVKKNLARGKQQQSNKSSKYQRLAKVMMLFVAVFIIQWWAYVVMAVLAIFQEPHPLLVACVGMFSNLGGVFNFFAYTLVRKKNQSVDDSEKTANEKKTAVTKPGTSSNM